MIILDIKNEREKKKIKLFNDNIKKMPSIVEFYASWCGHCKELKPIWKKMVNILKKKYKGECMIVQVEENAIPHIKCKKNIVGYPTIAFYKNNKKLVNYNEKDRSLKSLLKFIKSKIKLENKKQTKKQKKTKKRKYNVIKIAKQLRKKNETMKRAISRAKLIIKYSPEYNPEKWNKNAKIKWSHNCYAYMLDKIDKKNIKLCKPPKCMDLKPQPGYAYGMKKLKKKKVSCKMIQNRMYKDNPAIKLTKNDCPPKYYMGALAVDPNKDYHYYRREKDGFWSHKDDVLRATNLDSGGKRFLDPKNIKRENDRFKLKYKDFCGYYCIPKNRTRKRMRGWRRRKKLTKRVGKKSQKRQ